MKQKILFLKQEDVIEAGVLDMEKILELVEKAFYLDGIGQVKNPPKTEMTVPDEDSSQSTFISMPVYIGGDINRAGVKWAAESKANMKSGSLPMGIDIVILSDPVTVLPIAILDGLVITAMRTAAAAGVAAKYLARKDSEMVGCIGAGIIGRTMIQALKGVLPNLKQIKLFDLNSDKVNALIEEFKDTGIEIIAAGSAEEAAKDADIVATMTTSKKPFVKGEWIKPGTMVIQMSSYEVEKNVVSKADKLVVDSWAQMKGNSDSVLAQMFYSKELDEDDVLHLKDVVSGKINGRELDDEITMFSSRGMGCLDIMVADYLYKQAIEKGIGEKLNLWEEVKWV